MRNNITLLYIILVTSLLSSCESETCKSCELHYNVLSSGDYTAQELEDLAQSSLYSDYDEYFQATYGESGNYCGISLSIIEDEETNIDLNNSGEDDLGTYWVCE